MKSRGGLHVSDRLASGNGAKMRNTTTKKSKASRTHPRIAEVTARRQPVLTVSLVAGIAILFVEVSAAGV
jgi:hypothetical protein